MRWWQPSRLISPIGNCLVSTALFAALVHVSPIAAQQNETSRAPAVVPQVDWTEFFEMSADLRARGLDQNAAGRSAGAIINGLKTARIRVVDTPSAETPHLQTQIVATIDRESIAFITTMTVTIASAAGSTRVLWRSGDRKGAAPAAEAPEVIARSVSSILTELTQQYRSALAGLPFGETPFGLAFGTPRATVLARRDVTFDEANSIAPEALDFSRLPRSHPLLNSFIVWFSPTNRLCAITATSEPVPVSDGRSRINRQYARILAQLESFYGSDHFTDKPNSVADGGVSWLYPDSSKTVAVVRLHVRVDMGDKSRRYVAVRLEGDEKGCPGF